MTQIIADFRSRTGNWPRRVDCTLFVDDEQHGIAAFENSDELFGWAAGKLGQINWYGGPGCVSKREFFAEVLRTAYTYDAVETLPHFPK